MLHIHKISSFIIYQFIEEFLLFTTKPGSAIEKTFVDGDDFSDHGPSGSDVENLSCDEHAMKKVAELHCFKVVRNAIVDL